MRFWKSFLLLIVGVLLVAASGRLHKPMQSLRWGGESPDEIQWDEDSDPTVKLVTVMLGPFRGVIADVLWIRSSRLQEEGKYFELVQLADMITKLEPRFPEVWDYHGWNMAYNVSVYFDEPEDRWRWVQNGYRLLRDDGLRYNPTNADIHESLSWIFQHKIGMNSDDAHRHYKREWYDQMDRLIPRGRLDKLDIPAALLADDAPTPYKPAPYEKMLANGEISTNLFRLVTEYKMRPRIMKQADDKYGPFDWRNVQAHSAYWALQGLDYAKEKNHSREQLHRRLSQSMMQQFEYGKPIILPESKYIQYFPNLDMVEDVVQSYTDAIEDIEEPRTFELGRRNFFRRAVPTLYTFGRVEEAKKYYDMVNELHPMDDRPKFEDYVLKLDQKEITMLSTREAFDLIVGNLVMAQLSTNPVEASKRFNNGKRIFSGFGERIQQSRQNARIGLGLWSEMVWASELWIARNVLKPTPLKPQPGEAAWAWPQMQWVGPPEE